MLAATRSLCKDEGEKNKRESIDFTQDQESSGQPKSPHGNNGEFPDPFAQKAQRKLEEAHRSGEDSFQESYLTEGEVQFYSNKREKQIDRISKAIVDEVESTKGKESANLFGHATFL